MADQVELQATLTRSDLLRFFVLHALPRRPFPHFFAGLGTVLFALMRMQRGDFTTTGWMILLVYPFIFAFVLAASSLVMALQVLAMKSNGRLLEGKQVVINADGIACSGLTSSQLSRWPSISRMVRTGGGLAFSLRDPRDAWLLIPSRALDPERIERIHAVFLASRTA